MLVRLECSEGRSRGARFELHQAPISIGRSRDNMVRFDSEERAVSGHHCLIYRQADRSWFVRDLGSTNGTFLNGFRVEDDREIESGDALRIGTKGPTLIVTIEEGTSTMPLPVQAEVAAPVGRSPRVLRPALLTLIAVLLGAAAWHYGRPALEDLLRERDRGSAERDAEGGFEYPAESPLEVEDLEDPPEIPLSELPPLDTWLLGRWALARTEGALVLDRAQGDGRLVIEVTRDPDDPDRFEGRALEIGAEHVSSGRLVDRVGRPILRFRYLREASERGGTAYFRVSRFDARNITDGRDGWISRNDRAYVDIRRGQLLGNAGAWLKEGDR